jgi:hypothetical protein
LKIIDTFEVPQYSYVRKKVSIVFINKQGAWHALPELMVVTEKSAKERRFHEDRRR